MNTPSAPSYQSLMQLFAERFSCRLYDPTPLSRQLIEQVLDAGRIAPSACNRQPWTFIVVQSQEKRMAIREAYDREWVGTAPAYIIICGDHSAAWHRSFDNKDHTDVDIAITTQQLCLAATSLGLGTCWICNFDPAKIVSSFQLPSHLEPIAILPIGYPADGVKATEKIRKSLSDITIWHD